MNSEYVLVTGPLVGGKSHTFAVRPVNLSPYIATVAAMDTLYFIGEGAGYGATVEYSPNNGWSVWVRWEDHEMSELLTEGHDTMLDALSAAWEAYQAIHASESPKS